MKTPGIYLLALQLRKASQTVLGKQSLPLPKGYYIYAGSALSGLEGRLKRHLRTSQPRHWHIDDLLTAGQVFDIQVIPTSKKADECILAQQVCQWPSAEQVPGFGASDCNCNSHLFHFKQRPAFSIYGNYVAQNLPFMFDALNRSYNNHAMYDHDPFVALITCILSLRTRDPVTFTASKRLFASLNSIQALANATSEQVAELIYPVGMYKQKSGRLIQIATILLEKYDGKVPPDINEMLTLPGVGRKTANLVRSFAFHLPAICVDTHVHRIVNRWGLLRSATPDETEFALREILPQQYWIEINPLLVQHGQQICLPRSPKCGVCSMKASCCYAKLYAESAIIKRISDKLTHPSLDAIKPDYDGEGNDKLLSPFE